MSIDCTLLREALPRILTYWRGWLRRRPDPHPRAGERGARERALVGAVIDAGFARPYDECALKELERAACAYGAMPRRSPLDPQEVSDELGLLRHAIWRCVHETHPEGPEGLPSVGSLDNAISVAVQAVLRGGHGLEV